MKKKILAKSMLSIFICTVAGGLIGMNTGAIDYFNEDGTTNYENLISTKNNNQLKADMRDALIGSMNELSDKIDEILITIANISNDILDINERLTSLERRVYKLENPVVVQQNVQDYGYIIAYARLNNKKPECAPGFTPTIMRKTELNKIKRLGTNEDYTRACYKKYSQWAYPGESCVANLQINDYNVQHTKIIISYEKGKVTSNGTCGNTITTHKTLDVPRDVWTTKYLPRDG